METTLEYKVVVNSEKKLSDRKLQQVADAVYAGIESEMEEVRKDPDFSVEDYKIQENHNKKE